IASSTNRPPMPPNRPPQTEPASRIATSQANRMRNTRKKLEDTASAREGTRPRIAAARRGGSTRATKPRLGRRNPGGVGPWRRADRPGGHARVAQAEVASRIRSQTRSEQHTSELQSREKLVCRLLLEQ